MEKNFICIVCPMGCELKADMDENGNLKSVSGNRCKRGEKYAEQESINPMRMLTSTVKIKNALYPRLPVITSESIPKEMIGQVMSEINKVDIKAPIHLRDVVIKNVCGLPVDIIASRSMKEVV